MSVVSFVVGGILAGWLAGILLRGGASGILGEFVVGIVGAFVGSFLFSSLGIHPEAGLFNSVVVATVGAVILIGFLQLFRRA